MRALGFNGPWDMTVIERPEPTPGDTDVVIDVIATGICGSDVHGYSGETDRRVQGQVMGHETVGRTRGDHPGLPDGTLVTVNPIIACGHCAACLDGDTHICSRLKIIGVEPSLDGSFADVLLMPRANIVPLADHVPPLHGALVEPLAVGYHALMRAAPVAGDRILVIGGGPIGQAAALAARREGLDHVLVSEPVAARRELLGRLGFASTSPQDLAADRDALLGGPATIVVDAVGIGPTFSDAIAHSAPRARLVLVGLGSPEFTIAPYGIAVAERVVLGSYCYSDDHFRSTAEWVSAGHPELDLLVDRTVGLEDGPSAFRAIAERPDSNKTLVLSGAGLASTVGAAR